MISAAYRALALKYHPDHDLSNRAARRMIELNQAYAMVRDATGRAQLERDRTRASYDFKVSDHTGARSAPSRAAKAGTKLEQGRYAGWFLRDLAAHDPDYLRWLARHTSGMRYRSEIASILGAAA